MSIAFNQITKISLAAVAASVATMAATFAPAQAALLNFSFTTEGGGTGSFKLNTSIVDENTSSEAGFFSNAILDLNFNGSPILSDGGVSTFDGGQETYLFFNSGVFISSNLVFSDIEDKLVNQLSSNPSDYNFLNGTFYYGNAGGFEGLDIPNSMAITGLTVIDPTAVPEPTATAAILAFGAIGAGSLTKRKMKRKASLTA